MLASNVMRKHLATVAIINTSLLKDSHPPVCLLRQASKYNSPNQIRVTITLKKRVSSMLLVSMTQSPEMRR